MASSTSFHHQRKFTGRLRRRISLLLLLFSQLTVCQALTPWVGKSNRGRRVPRLCIILRYNFAASSTTTLLGCADDELLRASPSRMPPSVPKAPQDSDEEVRSLASWRSTSGTGSEIVFSGDSCLDSDATVQVRKRAGGWHTLGIVGGPAKSIYHGVFRKDERTGLVDPYALGPSEYLRAMASAALCLSAETLRDVRGTATQSKDAHNHDDMNLRFLHMGYGSGSLPRFLQKAIPESRHRIVELDPTVVQAARGLGLLDPDDPASTDRVSIGDALEFLERNRRENREEPPPSNPRFHGVCIDVFDGANRMPPGFCTIPFLKGLREELLLDPAAFGGGAAAFVLHNFHAGNEALEDRLRDAMASYRSVFGSSSGGGGLYRLDSLDTNPRGGNTILIAVLRKETHPNQHRGGAGDASAYPRRSLLELAALATEQWEDKRFDIASRVAHTQPF